MRRWTLALAVAIPVDACAMLALPGVLGGAVDAVLAGRAGTSAVVPLAVVLTAGALAGAVVAAAGPACSSAATLDLRVRLLGWTLPRRPDELPWDSGDLTARLTSSAADAGGLAPARLGAGAALLTSVGAVIGLGVLSPWLALAFFGGALPGVLLVRLFLRTAGEVFTRYQEVQAELAARLTDALAGARSIRAADAVAREARRVLRPLPELGLTGRALWSAQQRTVWRATVLVAAVELAVLGTAGLLIAAGSLPPGALAAAGGWAALGLGFFEQAESLVGVAHAHAGRSRLEELNQSPPPHSGTKELTAGTGQLTFREVRVGDHLGPIDLTVPGGTTLAVVGRSGSGKSLLAALAGGLLRPDGGEVLIDGVPVTELTAEARRRAVGYAFERPHLVGRTLRRALEGAGPAETVAAQAEPFLRRLPCGIDTPINELRLSGGELQRLGLARMLAARPRVVILDDATASLDMATEYQVNQALAHSTRGRTRLVISHRPRAAAQADLVAWLDHGRLRALAPHALLLADPDYRSTLSGSAAEEVAH